MPRPHRRRDDHVPLRSAGLTRTESGPDGEWVVRALPGSSSDRDYRCPGCDQLVRPGTPHVVAWPVGAVDERRHWHTPCWAARGRRRPGRRR